jgi:hypothetical protein
VGQEQPETLQRLGLQRQILEAVAAVVVLMETVSMLQLDQALRA